MNLQIFQDFLKFLTIYLEFTNTLELLETFKNHKTIFGSLQDIPGLVKLQESYLGPSENPVDFQKS